MWEHYDGINENGEFWSKDMNSFNHYAYGAVYDWIFENAVGIKRLKPKYEEIFINPIIDKRLGFVQGSYLTEWGEISVKWYFNDSALIYEVEIPEHVKATIQLINGRKYTLTTGKTTLSCNISN